MTITLEALLRRAIREAGKIFDKHGEISPLWFLTVPGEEETNILPNPPPPPGMTNEDYKDRLAMFLREQFTQAGVTQYVQVAECWATITEPVGNVLTVPSVRPSQDPARRELVFYEASDGVTTLLAYQEIVRSAGCRAVLGKVERVEDDGTNHHGRFANMLRPAPVQH